MLFQSDIFIFEIVIGVVCLEIVEELMKMLKIVEVIGCSVELDDKSFLIYLRGNLFQIVEVNKKVFVIR